jgi:hypothetical protein
MRKRQALGPGGVPPTTSAGGSPHAGGEILSVAGGPTDNNRTPTLEHRDGHRAPWDRGRTAIRRRGRLPDWTKCRKTFDTEHQARVREATVITRTASGDVIDPGAGRVTLTTVYESWIASRINLSPKVRRGYQDNCAA